MRGPAYLAQRRALIAACRRMNALGINQGTSGNVSLRVAGGNRAGFLVSPSGVPYDAMAPDDVVLMRMGGAWEGKPGRKPSSEWRFHHDILKARPDAGAVIHTHAMFCTTLSCLRRGIPAFHYMVAVAGGESIRCADYATFGTQALSDAALRALEGRSACLLANHGMIALGATLETALALAVEVETLAAQYWRALQIGEPVLLSKSEMAEVIRKFRAMGYGAVDRAREEGS